MASAAATTNAYRVVLPLLLSSISSSARPATTTEEPSLPALLLLLALHSSRFRLLLGLHEGTHDEKQRAHGHHRTHHDYSQIHDCSSARLVENLMGLRPPACEIKKRSPPCLKPGGESFKWKKQGRLAGGEEESAQRAV